MQRRETTRPLYQLAIATLAALAFAPHATGQPAAKPQSFCAKALKRINNDLRDVQLDTWKGITDNSAHREQNRIARAQLAATRAAINLAAMRDAKCAMPTTVYSEELFAQVIADCVEERKKTAKESVEIAVITCETKLNAAPDEFK